MSDVSFVKGDRMELLDDSEPDWWRVRHLRTNEEGLIPWNFVAEEKSVESEEYETLFIYKNINIIKNIINNYFQLVFWKNIS